MAQYFENVPVIKYEGKDSKNDFAFKYYNPEEVVGGKTMREHLRFTMSYWHTLAANGSDPFGVGTYQKPWDNETDPLKVSKMKMEAAFESPIKQIALAPILEMWQPLIVSYLL